MKEEVNLKIRFEKMMMEIYEEVEKGWIGEVVDLDEWMEIEKKWGIWKLMKGMKSIEIEMN